MLTLLACLLVLIGILIAAQLLHLAFLVAGYWWIWHSHRWLWHPHGWLIVVALVISVAIGIMRALRSRSEPPTIQPPDRSASLPMRHERS